MILLFAGLSLLFTTINGQYDIERRVPTRRVDKIGEILGPVVPRAVNRPSVTRDVHIERLNAGPRFQPDPPLHVATRHTESRTPISTGHLNGRRDRPRGRPRNGGVNLLGGGMIPDLAIDLGLGAIGGVDSRIAPDVAPIRRGPTRTTDNTDSLMDGRRMDPRSRNLVPRETLQMAERRTDVTPVLSRGTHMGGPLGRRWQPAPTDIAPITSVRNIRPRITPLDAPVISGNGRGIARTAETIIPLGRTGVIRGVGTAISRLLGGDRIGTGGIGSRLGDSDGRRWRGGDGRRWRDGGGRRWRGWGDRRERRGRRFFRGRRRRRFRD